MKDIVHLVRAATLGVAHARRTKPAKGSVRLFLAEDYLKKALRQLERYDEVYEEGQRRETEPVSTDT